MIDAQKKLYGMAKELSMNGKFPKVKGDVFKYRYKPYEDAIKDYVSKAIPEYKKAKANGLLNDKTVDHFEKLCKLLKIKIL